jgi:hypothetical protein
MAFNARMDTAAHILDLFEEYSIECPDGTLNGAGAVIPNVQQIVATNPAALMHNIVTGGHRTAFVELVKSTTMAQQTAAENAVADTIVAREGRPIEAQDFAELNQTQAAIKARFAVTNSVRGRSTLKCIFHAAATPTTVPCYFLPWNPTGGAVELKIPNNGGGPAGPANPNLFLTAALSGCSIYVDGPANSPTIFHCGTQFDTPGAEAATFWNQVISELGRDASAMGKTHNKDYTVPVRGEKADLKAAVKREKTAKSLLQAAHNDTVDVEEVRSWGAVFGVRDGTDWTFYMQENCTVTYHKIRKTKYLGQRKSDGESRTYSRPMYCKEIFPNSHGRAVAFRQLRRLKV